jgi:AcrR family transcriptional regulator
VSDALLEAAERILDRDGPAGLTTRRLAREADVSPALVHYHFRSIDELCARLVAKVSEDLLGSQRKIFRSRNPFSEQWRQATQPLRGGNGRRRMKVWTELSAMAFNNPTIREPVAAVTDEWRGILASAIERERERADPEGVVLPVDQVAGVACLLLKAMYVENLHGYSADHQGLLGLVGELAVGWAFVQ